MVAFLADLHHAANVTCSFGAAGGPWEFNLRDLLRWCQLAESAVPAGIAATPEGAAQVQHDLQGIKQTLPMFNFLNG